MNSQEILRRLNTEAKAQAERLQRREEVGFELERNGGELVRIEVISEWCVRGEGDEEEGIGGLDEGESGEGGERRGREDNGGWRRKGRR